MNNAHHGMLGLSVKEAATLYLTALGKANREDWDSHDEALSWFGVEENEIGLSEEEWSALADKIWG